MHSKISIAALFGAFVAASAQTTTPSSADAQATGSIYKVLLPGADSQTLLGSIVAVQSSLTTIAVACPSGTDSDDCGMPDGGMKITQGSATMVASTVIAEESDPVVVTYGWECSIGGTTSAECVYSATASVTGSLDPSMLSSINAQMTATTTTTKLNEQDLSTALMPVTITAGAEKLKDSASVSASGSASGSASASSATGSAKGSASASGSGSASVSGSGSSTGSAAAAQYTGSASNVKVGGLAIGGALAAVFML